MPLRHLQCRPRSQRGATLVELLVGLVIALVIMTGAFSAYMAVTTSARANVIADRLHIDTQTILDIMVNELRRAGYSYDAATTPLFTNIYVQNSPYSCILYSYDANDNGTLDQQEYYGFRQRGNNIETRTSGSASGDCNNGTWMTLNDPSTMTIPTGGLRFTITPQSQTISGVTVTRRRVTIELTAQSPNDSDGARRVASATVTVRTDNQTP